MKVLVTGSTGFLGQAIVEECLSNGIEVVALSRTSQHFQADIVDEKSFDKLLKLENIDAVIHSAGLAHQFGKIKRENFFQVNVKGTENILKLAKTLQTKCFILISSVAVYGDISKFKTANVRFQEDSGCNPIGDYAQSKYEAEQYAINFCTENKLRLVVLRPATIIGEGDKGNVARLIGSIKKKRFFWIGSGENLKSLVNKKDVAAICLFLLQTSKTGIYNVTSKPLKMREIVETIANELCVKIPKVSLPNSTAKIIARFSNTIRKWLSDDVFSGEKIRIELGFEAKSDIKQVLRREVRSLEN